MNTDYRNSTRICPECGSTRIIRDYDRGELVCDDCGMVLVDQYIDDGPDWRAYDSEQEKSRSHTGDPQNPLLPTKGHATIIKGNRDSNGKIITQKDQIKYSRISRLDRQASDNTERNEITASKIIEQTASVMNLPNNVKDNALFIYGQALKKNLIRGRSIGGVIAASIYAACKQSNTPRSLDEISLSCYVSKTEITRTYKVLKHELKLNAVLVSPQDFVHRFSSELGVSEKTHLMAVKILRDSSDKISTFGKDPAGIAAASLYISSKMNGEDKKLKEIAEITGVAESTIRNRQKDIEKALQLQ